MLPESWALYVRPDTHIQIVLDDGEVNAKFPNSQTRALQNERLTARRDYEKMVAQPNEEVRDVQQAITRTSIFSLLLAPTKPPPKGNVVLPERAGLH